MFYLLGRVEDLSSTVGYLFGEIDLSRVYLLEKVVDLSTIVVYLLGRVVCLSTIVVYLLAGLSDASSIIDVCMGMSIRSTIVVCLVG